MSAGRAASAMLAAGICFALVEWLGGHLHGALHPAQVVWSRYAVHLTALAVVAAVGRRNPLSTGKFSLQVARGLLMLVMPAAFVAAIQRLGVHNTWSIFWIAPLFAGLMAWIFLAERAGPRTWVFGAGAYAASLVLLRPEPRFAAKGALAAGVMAASLGAYLVVTRTLRSESTLSRLWYTAFVVFVALTPFIPRVFVNPSMRDGVVLGAIGLVGLAGLWFIDHALDAGSPAALASFLYAAPPAFALLDDPRPGGRALWAAAMLTAIAWWALRSGMVVARESTTIRY